MALHQTALDNTFEQWRINTNLTDSEAIKATAATGSATIPASTTANRDITPQAGYFRFNTTLNQAEIYNGTSWGAVGAGATGGIGNAALYENDTHITANYTITAGKNAMSAGPIIIDNTFAVTVPDGSAWTIV